MSLHAVPSYVVEFREKLKRLKRKQRWIIRHFLPAPRAVRTLIQLFKRAIRREKEAQRIGGGKQKVDWYARYWPIEYLPVMKSEAAVRLYSYFLMTLRMHARTLSRPPHPERLRGAAHQSNAYQRLRCAPDALEAVGKWWLGLDRSDRPWTSPEERKALRLCARIARFKAKDLEFRGPFLGALKRHTKAMEWETKRLDGWRKARASSRKQ